MSQLEIHQIPVLQDTYVYLAHGAAGDAAAVVAETRRRKDAF